MQDETNGPYTRNDTPATLGRDLNAFLSAGGAPVIFTLSSFAPKVFDNFHEYSLRAARA